MFNNFLRKNFVIITILFFYTGPATAEPLAICGENYYLARCGKTSIGTNWLKGIKGATPDYYSYDLPDSDTTNITNLRKFFAGVEQIIYKTKDGETQTVSGPGYKTARDTILENFCLTQTGELETVKCERCPNNASVFASSVDVDNNIRTWHVYTIADCYMDEFSDHTGTFVYVPNNSAKNSASAKKCYYSNDVEGDELVSE